MSYQEILSELSKKVPQMPAFREALAHLGSREIRVLLDGREECALFYSEGAAHFEARPAQNPDVEFSLSIESARSLLTESGQDMAEFGIAVVKQVMLGGIKIRLCNGILAILTGGYLGIVKAAGPDFLKFLALHGVSSLNRLISIIKSMKT